MERHYLDRPPIKCLQTLCSIAPLRVYLKHKQMQKQCTCDCSCAMYNKCSSCNLKTMIVACTCKMQFSLHVGNANIIWNRCSYHNLSWQSIVELKSNCNYSQIATFPMQPTQPIWKQLESDLSWGLLGKKSMLQLFVWGSDCRCVIHVHTLDVLRVLSIWRHIIVLSTGKCCVSSVCSCLPMPYEEWPRATRGWSRTCSYEWETKLTTTSFITAIRCAYRLAWRGTVRRS